MISVAEIVKMIQDSMPGAEVNVMDRTGMQDHFLIQVVSADFEGVGIMDRHRKVQLALSPAMSDGRLHAAEIKTATPAKA